MRTLSEILIEAEKTESFIDLFRLGKESFAGNKNGFELYELEFAKEYFYEIMKSKGFELHIRVTPNQKNKT